jgi:hypothetical protein
MLSPKQKKIASKAGDPNKIEGKDFEVLRSEKAKGRGMGLQDEKLPAGKMVAEKMGGGMVDPTMANYQKGGSVMARGNKIARIKPTKLY